MAVNATGPKAKLCGPVMPADNDGATPMYLSEKTSNECVRYVLLIIQNGCKFWQPDENTCFQIGYICLGKTSMGGDAETRYIVLSMPSYILGSRA